MLRRLQRPYKALRNFRNPLAYLRYKFGWRKREPRVFELRNRVVAEVPARLLHTFKESVFAEDYLAGFPRRLIRRQDQATVIDVGANAGYFSLWWLSRFPRSRVIAVEPMPNNFALLERNKALNPDKNLSLLNCAMGAENGQVVLHFDRGDSFTTAASILPNKYGSDEIRVKTISLPQLLADLGIDRLDFLKLDCEGSEYDILYSCGADVLAKIRGLGMETHPGAQRGQSKEALCEFLRSQGFHVRTRDGSAMVYAWRT